MRGKGLWIFCERFERGITPAYAGKSTGGGLDGTFYKDHPRLCGEKAAFAVGDHLLEGSPPPMRGKESRFSSAMVFFRITPAYAGKSPTCDFCGHGTWDHPRLCGEKSVDTPPLSTSAGSPPPMRGKASFSMMFIKISEDHPRLCGEKTRRLLRRYYGLGSPPPMRGKVSFGVVEDILDRITPAYAGKRQRQRIRSSHSWDHPRLCGEKTKKIPKQRYFFHQPASFSFSLQYT